MNGGAKRALKRIALAMGVLMLLFIGFVAVGVLDNQRRAAERDEYYQEHKDEIEAQKEADFMELGFSVEDSIEDLVVDTYRDSFTGSSNVYDSAYLDRYFDHPSPSVDEVKSTLEANQSIPGEYKAIIDYFIDRVYALYPETDFRPFEFNLRTLEMVEVDEWGMGWAALSPPPTPAIFGRRTGFIYLRENRLSLAVGIGR